MIAEVISNLGKLTLISGRDGQVVGAPHREHIGEWIKPGKAFCEIGDPHHLEAHLLMDQSDIDLIRVDNTAWVKVYGKSEITYKSHVSEIATRNRDEVPTEMSNMAGGEIASKPDKKTGSAKPITPVYEVIIPLENPHLKLEPGLRGFAKIDGGTSYPGMVALAVVLRQVQLQALI